MVPIMWIFPPRARMCSPAAARVCVASSSGISSETVWNDGANGGASGGGISSFFALPAWQEGLSALTTAGRNVALTMRGVPDVAGDADPETGYDVRVDGTDTVIGGTSAVAPLWAALIARINAIDRQVRRASSIRTLYRESGGSARHHRGQQRRRSPPQAGWDACTGLGSPNGVPLAGPALAALNTSECGNRPRIPVTIR